MFAGLGALEQLAPFQRADLQFDTNLGEIRLHHLCRQRRIGNGRRAAVADEQRQLRALRPGLLQQGPRARGVVRPVLEPLVVAEQRRGVGVDRRRRRAGAEHRVQQRLLVDRQVDGLAHARVVQRLVLGIEGDVGGQQGVGAVHRQARFLLQLRHVGRLGVERDLALAAAQFLHAHVGVEGDGEHQVVDRRLAAEVVRIGLVADLCVAGVAAEDEGAGADRLGVEPVLPAGLEQLVAVLGRVDGGEAHGHVGEEGRLRVVQGEAHGQVVELVHRLDQLAHVHRFEVGVAAWRRVVPGMLRVQRAPEAPEHVVGVEVAVGLEVRGAVELHPRAQVEGVGQPVGADLPALRQGRDDLRGAGAERHQAAEQRLGGGVGGDRAGVLDDVEAFRAGFGADHQVLRQRGAGAECQEQGQVARIHAGSPTAGRRGRC
ncbi:hypothetical protein FQZ97_615150 [compost metagenome]